VQNKSQIDALILKLFNKTISLEEKKLLNTWIRENKEHLLQMQNIWHVSHPVFKPDEIDIDKAITKIMRNIEPKITRTKKTSLFVWWQRVAAVLIIPVMLWSTAQYNSEKNRKSNIAFQEIMSPLGMQSEISLPDGSHVWLNSGSTLKYPVEFTSENRELYLTGEAFFKVKSDKDHPFIVSTKNLKVTATGTAFNIESYKNDSITAVTLLEGKVNVKIGNVNPENISPNQRLVFNKNAKKYTVIATDAKHWCVWKDGILAFRNEPLEDVFKRIGRTYNVYIEVKDKMVGQQLYRATFEGESLDEILHLLKLSAPIRYNRIKREQQTNNEFNKERIEVYNSK